MKIKLVVFFVLNIFIIASTSIANSKNIITDSYFYSFSEDKNSGSFQLMKDIQLNLEKGFYSLVIANANQLEKNYPNSRFLEKANRCKAEALYFLGRKREAKLLLDKLDQHQDVLYLKGRIYFDDQNYNNALVNFYESAKFYDKNEDKYFSCLYYSAKSYIFLGEFKRAKPILLSIIEKKGYSSYKGEVSFLLAQCFYEEQNFKQVCTLFEKTETIHSSISEKYFRKILLMTASSYDAVKNSKKAQVLYTKIAQDYDIEGLDIAEFWVKSGIDSFNEKDFSDSLRCFEVAKNTENFSSELMDMVLLYETAIKSNTIGYESAIKFLEENPTQNKKLYYILLCSYSAKNEDYKKSIFYGEKILEQNFQLTKKEEQVYFWYALSLLKTNQKNKALDIANKITETTIQVDTLKAKIQFNEKSKRFSEIYKNNSTSNLAFENYVIENLIFSNTNFLTNQKNSKDKYLLDESDYKNYFLALAYFLEENWNSCIYYIDKHLTLSDKKTDFAKYYKAYSLYMLQNNHQSYSLFLECANTLPKKTKFNSLYFASQCALAIYNENIGTSLADEWLKNAILHAKSACDIFIDENIKLDCLIYLSQLYSLSKEYQEGISLLLPYTNKTDEISLKCLYVLADLYKKSGQIEKSNQMYQQVSDGWPKTEIAQESLFLQGKLFFESGNWGESADKFSLYRKTYPNGKFYLQSCYYNGIALKNLGNDTLAILLLEECANSKDNSEFNFISLVELMNMYRQKGDYENAVNKGSLLIKNYPEQAKEKNIKNTIEEITYLASGEDEKNASFLAIYTNEGGMKTEKGRNAGFRLGENYILALSTKDEGYKLLKEFVSNVPKNTKELQDIENLAKAYYLLGTYYREKLQYENASKKFLLSAQNYATFNKDLTCRALYGAIESFDCNSNFADSKETYLTMKEKYPDSQWTQRAYSVVSEYLY